MFHKCEYFYFSFNLHHVTLVMAVHKLYLNKPAKTLNHKINL